MVGVYAHNNFDADFDLQHLHFSIPAIICSYKMLFLRFTAFGVVFLWSVSLFRVLNVLCAFRSSSVSCFFCFASLIWIILASRFVEMVIRLSRHIIRINAHFYYLVNLIHMRIYVVCIRVFVCAKLCAQSYYIHSRIPNV